MDAAATILGLATLPAVCRRLPASFAAYGAANVAVPLASGTTLSMGRFLSVSFPHFLALAALLERVPRLAAASIVVSSILYLFAAKALVDWQFIG